MTSFATYARTLRYLRPVQIYGRVLFHLHRPRLSEEALPPERVVDRTKWIQPASRRPSLMGPTTFRFLNESRDLQEAGWDSKSVSRLWRYNLHYFDDLNAADAPSRRAWHLSLVLRWIDENPPTRGSGWEPYPTSLRIVNWIKWALAGNTLPHSACENLALQTRWLAARLEKHLLGNHLFSNAKAMVFAGLFFDGAEAKQWYRLGCAVLEREIAEQILADGGQFERSPMYHALALEDMLDLTNIARTVGADDRLFAARIPDMVRWLRTLCHPDGELAFFNDTAWGIAPAPLELDEYAGRLGFRVSPEPSAVSCLVESGYIRMEDGEAVLIVDVAPIGPDYLPAHAHADTLSFELSLGRQRVIVNSGTSRYQPDEQRQYERSTAAHNTVVIDGENSSEVWGSFRVARRARPFGLEVADKRIGCSHDGYRRLAGRPIHRRVWDLSGGQLIISDRIEGRFQRAQARFHLHPAIAATLSSESVVHLDLPDGTRVVVTLAGAKARLEYATFAPEFGVVLETRCIAADCDGHALQTMLEWDTDRLPA